MQKVAQVGKLDLAKVQQAGVDEPLVVQHEKPIIGVLAICHSLMKKHKLNVLNRKSLVVLNGYQGVGLKEDRTLMTIRENLKSIMTGFKQWAMTPMRISYMVCQG